MIAGAGSRRLNSIKIRIPNCLEHNHTVVQIHYLAMREEEEDDNKSRHGAQLDCNSRPPSLLFSHCELTKKHDLSCVLRRGLAQSPYRSLTLELWWPFSISVISFVRKQYSNLQQRRSACSSWLGRPHKLYVGYDDTRTTQTSDGNNRLFYLLIDGSLCAWRVIWRSKRKCKL